MDGTGDSLWSSVRGATGISLRRSMEFYQRHYWDFIMTINGVLLGVLQGFHFEDLSSSLRGAIGISL